MTRDNVLQTLQPNLVVALGNGSRNSGAPEYSGTLYLGLGASSKVADEHFPIDVI
jgi:hypothetical protein